MRTKYQLYNNPNIVFHETFYQLCLFPKDWETDKFVLNENK